MHTLILFLILSTFGVSAQSEQVPLSAETGAPNILVEESLAEVPATEELTEAETGSTPTVTVSPQGGDISSALTGLADAARAGNILVAVAFMLTILVWALRTFLWKTIKPALLPYLTVAVSGVTTFTGAVLLGKTVVDALLVGLGGVLTGLAAVGSWEIGKPALRRKK